MRRNRLTDNDRNFGPITIGERSATWRPIRLTLESGCDEYPGACITAGAFGWSVRLALPSIIKPWREWVDTSKYAWSTSAAGGYWEVHRREYGFSLSDGFLQVFLGAQTHDSTTTQNWCKHLPWTQWRYMGIRYFGLMGEELLWQPRSRWTDWEAERVERDAKVPHVKFRIKDFDGQEIVATTRMEQREYLFGEGWFKWLSVFRSRRLYPALDISFNKETGTEKGSWKGGTMGTGIDMLPGELHEDAFKRYCKQEHRAKDGRYRVQYIGRA